MRMAMVVLCIGVASCRAFKPAPAPAPFVDAFSRETLGDSYRKSGGSWRVLQGALTSFGDHNQPLWLVPPLSKNVRVEFTAWSDSAAVDTKIEIFGDGVTHSTGYIVILGGWNNTITTIARLDEHETTRQAVKRGWNMGQRYRWRVQRTDGHTLEMFIDDARVLAYDDAKPLQGERNNRLAFTSWASEVHYDDLVVTPLPD